MGRMELPYGHFWGECKHRELPGRISVWEG